MANASSQSSELFFTDKQLCDRWQCSHMKLWRLRRAGKMPLPIKIGGAGANLTPESVVRSMEAANNVAA